MAWSARRSMQPCANGVPRFWCSSMPIRQGGRLASRVSTCPRDHFCRNTIAPRLSCPTTWNEFLPISMPITAIAVSSSCDMACSLGSAPPSPASLAAGAGARPDHSISGHPRDQRWLIGSHGIPSGSLGLDACGLHYLSPLLGFPGDESTEVAGRAWKCGSAQPGKSRLHRGIG